MKIVEVPIVVSNTEGQGTRRGSVAARGIGGATDRDSLSTRDANGATMLMEEDTAALTKLLLVWLVIEVREIIGRLLVSDEVEQPQEFAVNAARGGHTRGQKRQRSMAVVRFAIRADFVSSTARSFLPNVNTSTLGGYQGAAGNTKGAAFRPHLQPSSNSPVDGSTDRGSWMGNPLLPGELSNRRGLCLKQGCAPTDYRTVSET